jgi:filamentous hemagglutinin family protein
MKPLRSLLLGLFLGSVIIVPVQAQITVDGTTNTNLTPIDNGIRIDDGNRAGDNLFHSFSEFSIGNGSEAFFNNANNIVNIFSRVTGGNISNIDGLIRANGTANLFLINPAGIIFGENASLDIGGSFFSSTAESIVFGDNVEFLATDADNPPLLTINMPIGLNFGNNPGEIAVNGSNLQVNNGETLALLGGNVTITGGQIIAPEGRIELGGLTQEGQITFNSQQLGEDFSIDSISFPEGIARADVTLTNSAEVNVQAAGGRVIGVTNDLDASSEFGLDGTIEINQLDVNPAEGLEELPTSVIDVTRLIAQNLCQQLKGSNETVQNWTTLAKRAFLLSINLVLLSISSSFCLPRTKN